MAIYRRMERDVIIKHNLLHRPGPYADFIKAAYPDSWQDALAQEGIKSTD